jgi:hypothetical protein
MPTTKAIPRKPQSKLAVDEGLANFVRLEIGASMRHRDKELNCAPMSNSEIQSNIVTVQLDEMGKHLSGLSDSISSLHDKLSPYIAPENTQAVSPVPCNPRLAGSCPVAVKLFDLTDFITEIRYRINTLTDRIQN